MPDTHRLIAIIPCKNLGASETFYARLGFSRKSYDEKYRILVDGKGGEIHLNAFAGWPIPGHNPFGLYLYADDVDELATGLGDLVIHQPENKPWGMYEFAVSDPDETLVRVGRRITNGG